MSRIALLKESLRSVSVSRLESVGAPVHAAKQSRAAAQGTERKDLRWLMAVPLATGSSDGY